MKRNARFQMKNVRQRVGSFPGLGEVAVQNHFVVAFHQAAEEQSVEVLRLSVGSETWIEIRGIGFDQQRDGVKILAIRVCARNQHKRGYDVTQ
jgi:hypothetical protein